MCVCIHALIWGQSWVLKHGGFLLEVHSNMWHQQILSCRDWGRRFMRLYQQSTSWDNPKDPERPLVIGYISPDYFTHSVSYFIEAPLAYHDYAKYKVVVYSAVVKVLIILNLIFYVAFPCVICICMFFYK